MKNIHGAPEIEVNPHLSFANNSKFVLDLAEKEQMKESLSKTFKNILVTWRGRSQRRMVIKSQVAGILELLTEPECLYCHRTWGLKCESLANLEDLFEEFFTSKGYSQVDFWEPREWQEYFREHSVFRTICYTCHDKLVPKQDTYSTIQAAYLIETFTDTLPLGNLAIQNLL